MKRLIKDSRNAKVAGVCAGIANYFEIDPTLVRILCMLTCFTGAGVIAYIAAAVIMPEG